MHDIKLNSVTKSYPGNKQPAVKGLSLEVEKGQLVTILGPSGCGKTTVLRLIAGFERQQEGEVYLGGSIVSSDCRWVPPEKRQIGMVFQDYALFPHLNVFDNVGFGYRGKDRAERVNEILEMVRLQGYHKRYPHQLSGGQQQRVALGRALARKPVVVLLDEPFSNLDTGMKADMRAEVRRIIKQAKATAVMVTHDQKDALAVSDKVLVLKEGTSQQYGTPREIYQFPENRFVANFVGQSNIMAAKIGKDRKSVITGLGKIPCSHTHNLEPGTDIYVSVRPDSLELAGDGSIEGVIKGVTYTGETIDAVVEADYAGKKNKDLLVHIHPENDIRVGSKARFKVLPDFVAVIRQ
ncbi:MAG: ABC transporter ATP-binding protein [Actinomycetota bacterium]